MTTRTLAEMVYALPTEQLLELQSQCIDAGIKNEFKVNYRKKFLELKKKSKGNLKNIYTALSRATPEQMGKIADILVKTH